MPTSYEHRKRMLQHLEEQQREAVKCPLCSGIEWFGGPSGGLSQNIMCANPTCERWFNHSPFGLYDLNQIGRSRSPVKALPSA